MTSSLSLINQDLGLILAILKKKKKRVEKKMAGSCLLPLRLWVSIRLRTTDKVTAV